MRARFHELAQCEFADATEYYRHESVRLATRFVTEVEKAVKPRSPILANSLLAVVVGAVVGAEGLVGAHEAEAPATCHGSGEVSEHRCRVRDEQLRLADALPAAHA